MIDHPRLSPFRRFLAANVSLALLLTSPGLLPYQALGAIQKQAPGPAAPTRPMGLPVGPAALPKPAVPAGPNSGVTATPAEAAKGVDAIAAAQGIAAGVDKAAAQGGDAAAALQQGFDKAALDKAAEALPFEVGVNLVGEFSGRDAVWAKIVELNKTQDVRFIVVADKADQQYNLNGGANIARGKANELARDGFMARGVDAAKPHTALSLFVGEGENVALYVDNVFGYKVAKVVKQQGGYAGALSRFDQLMQSKASTKAAQTPPSPELLKAATPRYFAAPLHKAAMYVTAGLWWVTDRLVGGKWDKIKPILLRVAYLYNNEQWLRLRVNDVNKAKPAPITAKSSDQLLYRSGDGAHFDPTHPDMGKSEVSYFTQIRKPKGPPAPIDEKAMAQAVRMSQLEARVVDPATGRPIIKEAGILNVHAASWIQFMVHDWMNHKRKAAADNPYLIALPEDHPMRAQGFTHMKLDRTADGKTIDGVPTYVNELTPGWDLSMLYGATDEIQATLRTFKDGKLLIGDDKRLLEDPRNPGLPLTGFNDNITPQLAFLHTVFTLEHNFVAEQVKAEHPEYNDEELFQIARLRLTALAARIHTVDWTRALLPQDGLQDGMWADWYGFVDKRLKGWVIRFSDRHPKLGKILGAFLRWELIFGIPGTRTLMYGKDYAMPEEFVDVYRLHTMIRDYYQMHHLKTGPNGEVEVEATVELPFEEMAGYKTQNLSKTLPLEDQALSWAMESAGALTLQNMALGLRRLHTQDGQHKDMAIVHDIRIKERSEASTYVKFTMKLGEKPPKTFLELTGGDKASADLLAKYFAKVEDVPFRIGILAERKPKDFALGNRQFKVFVLMAPRRLKSDKFLSQMYDPKYYGGVAGMNYVDNTMMTTIVMRHFPETRPALQGVDSFFKPLPTPGTLSDRVLESAEKAVSTSRTPAQIAIIGGFLAALTLAPVFTLVGIAALGLGIVGHARMKVAAQRLRWVQFAVDRGAIDSRRPLMGVRELAAKGAANSKLGIALAAVAVAPMALSLAVTVPLLGIAGGVAAVAAILVARKKVAQAGALLAEAGIELDARTKRSRIDPATMPGETAIQKRYWFLVEGKDKPVAKFGDTFGALKKSGLPKSTAFVTALLSHVGFAKKTQMNLTADEKKALGLGRFDIYVPNMIDAQDNSNTRVYAPRGNAKGLKPGDVDMAEIDWMFRQAGNPLELTAYHFGLIREAAMARDAAEGRGTWFSRLKGRFALKRRHAQLLQLFADRVVWQEAKYGAWAPAISRERLIEFYQGSAQREMIKDRTGR